MNEHEVEAELLHEFRAHGAVPGYEQIVGGGANACVLHYRANNAPLRDGDLLLIDAGAEYMLRLRHHAHVSGQRPLLAGAARALRHGARGADRRDRRRRARASRSTLPRGRGAVITGA